MTKFEPIKVTDYKVELGLTSHKCYVRFKFSPKPEAGWVKEFKDRFRVSGSRYRGRIVMKIEGCNIELDAHTHDVEPRLKKAVEECVESANGWYAYKLEEEARRQTEAEEYKQLKADEKRRREREEELKRKLIGDEEEAGCCSERANTVESDDPDSGLTA